MTTPMLMTKHPTEELLASYIDDQLEPATREPVTEHLTSCGACREIVLMSTAYQMDEETANVTPGNFGARRWMAAIGGLAAAAAIAVIVVRPSSWFGYEVDDLRAASLSQPKRISVGRLDGFAYQEKPDGAKRGEEGKDVGLSDVELLNIAAELAADVEKGKSPDPHVVGLTTLLIGKNGKDFSDAVAKLEEAYRKAGGAERDSIAIDLAAALIAKAGWSGDAADYRRALELSNDVLKRTQESPEALWNRAVAKEALYPKAEALGAWDDYLKVDPDSQWAIEALEHKADLQSDI